MITQQVVTYIKEQLSRGISRDKIRSNLLSAGWIEEDINQAFSFAEPAAPSAALKIAPAFAVENEFIPNQPIDKTSILKKDEPIMPILKKDNPPALESNPNITAQNINPILSALPISNPSTTENILRPTPVSATAINPVIEKPVNSSLNTIQVDSVRSLGDSSDSKLTGMSIPKEKKSGLKNVALLLFVVLLFGNLYLWIFVLPRMNNLNISAENSTNLPAENNIQTERLVSDNSSLEEMNTSILPGEELVIPASKLQLASSNYFAKYNSYGGVNMPLGSCNAAGTVFVDPLVKTAIEEIANITGRVPQCSLTLDNNTSSSNIRSVSYLVYTPMEDGGYCIDSSGAALIVSKIPMGSNCASGL